MRRHAKASSAASTKRQGKGPGAIVRGAFATRGISSDADGSGAPSARRLAVLLSALIAIAGLTAATASAAPIYPFLETFGSANQPSFENPRGVAIDQATGDVYVMDNGSPPSIKRYNPDGTPDSFSALAGNAIDGKEGPDATPQEGLGFSGPTESQIAIDNSGGATDGDIYVTQSSPNLINIFSSTGAYLGQLTAADATDFTEACGVAVDPSGAVYVGDFNSGIHKFVPAANPPVNADYSATFTTTTKPCTLAAGAGATAGFLFPAQYVGPISKIDSSTGELKYSFSEGVTTVSVDPANGHVYAVRDSEFTEFDASGAGSASAIGSRPLQGKGTGLAVRGTSGSIFVSRQGAINLEVFGPLTTLPTVMIEPASGITATEATLSGTVDPEGVALSECKFEWGPTTGNGYPNSVPCEQAVPTDSSAHAVSADISGLSAGGSKYRFRLIAKNANGTETSDPDTFSVGAHIDGAAATAGIEEATLRGAIDPNGEATTYKFEWGPTGAYGNVTPLGNLSAGDEPVAVEEGLTGLTSGQTYHFRLLATNGKGTTTGPDETFTLTIPPQFPARAYELVSPYPTGGIPVNLLEFASADGNHVQIGNFQPLPGTKVPALADQIVSKWLYQSDRTASGWKLTQTEVGGFLDWPAGTSVDGSRFVFPTQAGWENEPRLDPDDRSGSLNGLKGTGEVYQRQSDGTFLWISRDPRIPVGTPQTALGEATVPKPAVASMSNDGRTIVVWSQKQLLDSDTTPNEGDNPGFWPFRLYKWHDGVLSFIGKRPDGTVPRLGSILGTSRNGDGITEVNSDPTTVSAVSRDGSRVVFSALRGDSVPGVGAIYVQTDGQPTVEATKPTGVPPLPPNQPFAPTSFRGASADASRVFFTSPSRFTPDSGATYSSSDHQDDLYAYDVGADKVRDLTPRLDGLDDPKVDPPLADRAGVLGAVTWSEDGKRVYFVANAQFDVAPNPQGELPSSEGRNLYLAEMDGIDDPVKLRFVAALGAGDEAMWQPTQRSKRAYASPDGSVLSFGSSEELTDQGLGGTNQLFVYDADANSLTCASCPPDGSLPKADVDQEISVNGAQQAWQTDSYSRRWVSSDGTAFFNTASRLVNEDQNETDDVYEYRSGKAHLVSPGTGTNASRFAGISRDGSTVFMNTLDALVPWDEEPGVPKIYAARVGGGLPRPAGRPAGCDLGAGACEGAGTKAPDTSGAGTAAFQGPGDPRQHKAAKRCLKGKRKVRRHGKTRCVTRKAKNHRRAGR